MRHLRHKGILVILLISLTLGLPAQDGYGQAVEAGTIAYIPLVVRPVTYDESLGIFDEDFDGDGYLFSDFPEGKENVGQALGIQVDGKIVAAGYAFNGSDYDFALSRYLTDGSLDTSFSEDGWLVTAVDDSGGNDKIRDLVLQPDGKIVVAGYTDSAGSFDVVLARYNPDGSLDMDFGGDGMVISDFYGGNDSAFNIALQGDGKLLVAGYTYQGAYADFLLARYLPDGSLDESFGEAGWVSLDMAGWLDIAYGLAVQGDGKILVAGQVVTGSDTSDFGVARYDPDGSLDPSFDGDGWLLTNLEGKYDIAKALVIQPDGKILVSGDSSGDMVVVRYNQDGTLDPEFNEQGWLRLDFYSLRSVNNNMILQPDGKIVLVGNVHFCDELDFAMARITTNGNLDRSFEDDGMLLSYFIDITEIGNDVQQQVDGKLVVVGSINNGTDEDFLLVRYR